MNYKIPDEYLGGGRKEILNDDIRYMLIALSESTGSMDPSTQVGACYVGEDGKLLTLGHNTPAWDPERFPFRGDPQNIGIENTKYPYIHHAEFQAMGNYKGNLSDFKNSTLYVTLSPCADCTRLSSLLGVKRIVCLNDRKYDDVDIPKVTMENCEIEHINLKDIIDIAKVEFDLTQNEKNNTKILKLKKD